MARKTNIDPSRKPEYIGERSSRSNTRERQYCGLCDRLATHRALRFDLDGQHAVPYDVYYCEMHLKQQIRVADVRRCKELPEFRRYTKKLALWKSLQDGNEQQSLELEFEDEPI